MVKKYLFILFVGLVTGNSFSQDIHFSQFRENSMLLNPGYTGMFEGSYRFGLNYKNQWASIGNVYKTYAASADFVLFKNYMGLKSTGIGISAFQDVAGSSNTKTTRVDLNISQTVYLSDNTDLSLGVGFSYVDMSANYAGLTWGSQYNGVEYDGAIGSGEAFTGYAEKVFDLSAGMIFRLFDENLHPLEIGVSAFHLVQPKIKILSVQDYIPRKFSVNASKEFDFPSTNSWGMKVLALASQQKRAREIVVGGLLRKDFGSVSKYTGYSNSYSLFFGSYYRIGDAAIPVVKMLVQEKLTVGVSYDFTVSNLSKASVYRGGPEFALSYIGPFKSVSVVSPKSFD